MKFTRTNLGFLILLLVTTMAHAQTNSLTALLQQGLLEEQANRNLDAAIANYQALIGQFDKDRHLASTAIFRLGECYRMLGRTNEAAAEYRRILKEFPEENPLTTLSKENLVGMGFTTAQGVSTFQSNLRKIQPIEPLSRPVASEEDAEIQRIREMVQNSPDLINAPTEGKLPPLCDAAMHGRLRVAEYLLTNGADINLNDGEPLLCAVNGGQNAMVELLLNHGATIVPSALVQAVAHDYKVVAQTLLDHHADVNALYNDRSPLGVAAAIEKLSLVQLLLSHGGDVNIKESDGRTPLSHAADGGRNAPVVKALLKAHADPNGGDVDSPLLCAIRAKDVESAKLLLQAGANPDAKGTVDWQSAEVSSAYRPHLSLTPLYYALKTKQLPMVQLLLKFKADPNHSQISDKPLVIEALDETNILLALLEGGASADAVDPDYNLYNLFVEATPLDIAVGDNNTSAVDILLKHGANPNERDEKGNTALHYAAEPTPADENIFKLLLDHKANPNIQNQDGVTPMKILKEQHSGRYFLRHNGVRNDIEAKKNAVELIDFLRQHGALDNLPNWDAIVASRPSTGYSTSVFTKGSNDWNHFSLLELIYEARPKVLTGHPPMRLPWNDENYKSRFPFPDLAHIVVVRPNADGTMAKRIEVNLFDFTNGIDFEKNMPLEFGDTVEIPEREHTLNEPAIYLSDNQVAAVSDYFKSKTGEAKLIVTGGKSVPLPIQPFESRIGQVLLGKAAQAVLTSESDLSRVKVTRHNVQTGKLSTWTLDCSGMREDKPNPPFDRINNFSPDPNNHAPDLWIRNGDVIEVPLKP